MTVLVDVFLLLHQVPWTFADFIRWYNTYIWVSFCNFLLTVNMISAHALDVRSCVIIENYPVPASQNLPRPMKTPPHNLGRSQWSRAPRCQCGILRPFMKYWNNYFKFLLHFLTIINIHYFCSINNNLLINFLLQGQHAFCYCETSTADTILIIHTIYKYKQIII